MIDKEETMKLHISNLDSMANESTLMTYFSKFGEVLSCLISKHPNGRCKGFANIIMLKNKEILYQILNMDHYLFEKRLRVTLFDGDRWTLNKRTVHLNGLPIWACEQYIFENFKGYGKIEDIKINKGRGSIIFASKESASDLIHQGYIDIEENRIIISEGKDLNFNKKKRSYKGNYQEKQYNYQEDEIFYEKKHKNFPNKPEDNKNLKNSNKRKKNNSGYFKTKVLEEEIYKRQNQNYFLGEFFHPEILRIYLKKIYKTNPNMGFIAKDKIKCLELFYFNRNDKYLRKTEKNYIINEMVNKVENNHLFSNLFLRK